MRSARRLGVLQAKAARRLTALKKRRQIPLKKTKRKRISPSVDKAGGIGMRRAIHRAQMPGLFVPRLPKVSNIEFCASNCHLIRENLLRCLAVPAPVKDIEGTIATYGEPRMVTGIRAGC